MDCSKQDNQITDKHSYDVEHDYWAWEAVISKGEQLQKMLVNLPASTP
jgi:hypothetical protein